MTKTSLADALRKVEEKAFLFENETELDVFLAESVAIIADFTGADKIALFFYGDHHDSLGFRAGLDNGKQIKKEDIDPSSAYSQFGLDQSSIDRAFQERTIVHSESRLIIPLQRGTERVGLLTLHHEDPAGVAAVNEAELREITFRIESILENASVLLRALGTGSHEVILGQAASDGVAVGIALPFEGSIEHYVSADDEAVVQKNPLAHFDTSLSRSLKQLARLQENARTQIDDMVSLIFSSHLLMLKDESFTGKMRELIAGGLTAAESIKSVVSDYAQLFEQMEEARFAEKAQDVRDLGYRLIKNLSDDSEIDFDYRGQIVIAKHIYPSDLVRMAVENVSGIVLHGSGVTAHLSILSRSLSLPVLIAHDKALLEIEAGTPLLLDATSGKLFVRPSESLFQEYRSQEEAEVIPERIIEGKTRDGHPVQVLANINLYVDAMDAVKRGADGIGLYRSEFPFIIWNDFLSEEQQFGIYRRIVSSMPGKPIVLRTADIGGDKLMQGRSEERNPFLGVRGIRFSLANREMFREQIRAMLRAGRDADLGIMLPMVSSVEEVLEAREEITRSIELLKSQGIPHNSQPRIGAMVELPAAAIAIEDLAHETDFLSIGTNDLTMYLLAVDRTNENLSHLYRGHHPTVLRTLHQIALGAGPLLSELSVCGDSASDPILIPFLLGIGIRKLSVDPRKISQVRRYLGLFSSKNAKKIADDMLNIRKIHEMEKYLQNFRKNYSVDILPEE